MQIDSSASLEFVTSIEDLRENIRRFSRDLPRNMDLARQLAVQTTYWVFDEDSNRFCPSKFIGFRAMTFQRYRGGRDGTVSGERFNGQFTREAVERILGRYEIDGALETGLKNWCLATFGSDVLRGVSDEKWRFVRTMPQRGYLTVVCNPDYYAGLEACRALQEIVWSLGRSTKDPQPGDSVIIWQAQGKTGKRGVIGIGEVLVGRGNLEASPEEKAFSRVPEEDTPTDRFKIRLHRFPNLPIWESDMPELSQLNAAKARGGTVFDLAPAQWHSVVDRATRGMPMDALAQDQSPSDRQGYMLSPAARKAVERHAQSMAEEHFLSLGYAVTDVSKRECYDLHCTGTDGEVHVEVKGTTGNGDAVFLTRNEARHAPNDVRRALVVVRRIKLDCSSAEPTVHGGEMQVILPWSIEERDLTPLQFEYKLPIQSS